MWTVNNYSSSLALPLNKAVACVAIALLFCSIQIISNVRIQSQPGPDNLSLNSKNSSTYREDLVPGITKSLLYIIVEKCIKMVH